MLPGRRRPRPARRSRNSSGFTLIELLIALVISSIVAGVVFEMILGQNRFARYQNAREEVQQNARTALELIASELRGLPPAAILGPGINSIQFALPRGWGVLCNPVEQATTTVWVRFPAGMFPTEFPAGTSATWGVAVGQPLPNNVEDVPEDWTFVTSTTDPGGTNPCSNPAALGPVVNGSVFERSFGGTGFFQTGRAPADVIPVGSPVFVFQIVDYDVNSSNVPGLWIRRNTQPTPQPMAGPVPAATGVDAGLQFTYMAANGAVILNPTAGDPTIARVGVRVRTNSTATINGTRQVETAFTEIYLRNRN